MSATARTAKSCPICGKPAADKFQPFCSQRCANVDLNRWLSGVYAVPAVEDTTTDADEADGAEPSAPGVKGDG